jgi:hypothetical protein
MRHRLSKLSAVGTLCALLSSGVGGTVFADDEEPHAKRIGIHIIIDDGSGNVRRTYLSEEERAKDNRRPWRERFMEEDPLAQPIIAAPLTTAPAPRPAPERAETPSPAAPAAGTAASPAPKGSASPAPAPATPLPAPAPSADGNSVILPKPAPATLPDGRKLPFGIPKSLHEKRGEKRVDESVDPFSALRNYGKLNEDLSSSRYESSSWQGGSRADIQDQDAPGLISSREWKSRFSPWLGRRDSDIEVRDSFQGERREMPLREQKRKEASVSPWSGERTVNLSNGEALVMRDRNQRFLTNEIRELKYIREAQNREEISMQAINRYQFRRTHPVEPGLPGVAPGGEVRSNRHKPAGN